MFNYKQKGLLSLHFPALSHHRPHCMFHLVTSLYIFYHFRKCMTMPKGHEAFEGRGKLLVNCTVFIDHCPAWLQSSLWQSFVWGKFVLNCLKHLKPIAAYLPTYFDRSIYIFFSLDKSEYVGGETVKLKLHSNVNGTFKPKLRYMSFKVSYACVSSN